MVLGDHRGHGLGSVIKRATTSLIQKEWPETQRIYTDNADQNTHMLRINTAMGFRRVGASIGWKLEVMT
jgi:RimJ/RimL family protein N-acetyltransferase